MILIECETAIGDVTPDGVGLRKAFLPAGARSLTASVWEVPVHETTQQMGDFYKSWLGEENKGDKPGTRYAAFRAAQLEALKRARKEHDGSAHLFYWAGVVYVGDPGDLPQTLLPENNAGK